ncbi:MAG: HipA domain-containing protein [Bacteroidetes bacterium]|nr:HipA domain-containing protein [Bacteroidota bacterium]
MSDCLGCCLPIEDPSMEYHPACAHTLFGSDAPPILPYAIKDINRLAKENVLQRVAVAGVQKKLSLHLQGEQGSAQRLTIVGLWGDYILKPPTEEYAELPELEHATMRMAEICGIQIVPNGLIRMKSGELAFITRRIDRQKGGGKRAMEDFCQLSERLTEHKYRGSVEQASKLILRHTVNPGYDLLRFFELLVFCFLTGNADMHLKNFSLYRLADGYSLTPAYDLLPSTLLLPDDPEESALTINGKKNRLTRGDFLSAASTMRIPERAALNSLERIIAAVPECRTFIKRSRVSAPMRKRYTALIAARTKRLVNTAEGASHG